MGNWDSLGNLRLLVTQNINYCKYLFPGISRTWTPQDPCLRYLHQLRGLASLRNLGSILTDLDRIVNEVQSQVQDNPVTSGKKIA